MCPKLRGEGALALGAVQKDYGGHDGRTIGGEDGSERAGNYSPGSLVILGRVCLRGQCLASQQLTRGQMETSFVLFRQRGVRGGGV